MTPSKNLGHASSTEKLLKASKSSSGLELELFFSLDFHQSGIPLLVSSALLRSRDLGQIDLARLKKDHLDWILEVGEVKSSAVGELQMEKRQKLRLMNAQKFLSALFGHRSKLIPMIRKIEK